MLLWNDNILNMVIFMKRNIAKTLISSIIIGFSMNISLYAYGQSPQNNQTINCWDYAGNKFNVDPWLLFSIASVESSFQEGIQSKNTNGTYDLGLMQINTIHVPRFAQANLDRHALQHDTCKNIIAAAYLLKQSINTYGYNIDGIGGYHSRTPHLRRAYGQKVINRYNELVRRYHINREPFSFELYNRRRRTRTTTTNSTYAQQEPHYSQPYHSTVSNNVSSSQYGRLVLNKTER